ncbi:phospholipid/cholesterol/gamma-HCH transport system substrate-binding protein [Saccharopolyspora antimicrobica]|uniref:Phospholipid/cholesterol/gamma-HCH transport system substrate-binding protein n=1 Tax=Saccharopolyspora antimicrobica TaxID=455193 RepID=A0A1I4RN46_9PSEU|nr:MCE family protein [Saccharopolyspora antimicrobica]RKT87946.1 phospholipid/cholesterol/gamma-HCH transport system substrate-binding protein [Saccharopolyspora antimicrobica]SFM53556.1 phospholipid/cholesterol/gamma-HCH transport system substrate-binding protein [Saccharopolyspora antimicrobica]
MSRKPLIVCCVLAVLVTGAWFTLLAPRPQLRVAADFTFADGIFPGSRVAILGVAVGRVESVEPQGATVRVRMSMPADTALPADARAYIMSPAIISDRYVELGPAHTGGPRLADGALIPVHRTRSPIRFDQLAASLDSLLAAFGPSGGDPGVLDGLLRSSAAALDGRGPQLRDAITELSRASEVLAAGSGDLGAVVDDLDQLVQLLLQHRDAVDSLAASTAQAGADFQAQQGEIGDVLTKLSDVLLAVDELVRGHGEQLDGDLEQLSRFAGTLADRQRELAETLDTMPLTMDNFTRAITPDQRLRLRLNLSTNLSQFDTTARLCRELPLPLCTGAGITNPVPFPPDLEPLRAVLGGGR